MENVTNIFDERTHHRFSSTPGERGRRQRRDLPWVTVAKNAMPPMMFQLCFTDGQMVGFAYNDLRELRCRDAGRLELLVQGIAPQRIVIQGRHLHELAKQFTLASVVRVQEGDPRRDEAPETAPEIVKITIEPLQD